MFLIEEDEQQEASDSIFRVFVYCFLYIFGASLAGQGFWQCRR